MGSESRWPTVALYLVALCLFFAALAVGLTTTIWDGYRIVLLFILQTFLVYELFTPLHDAVHRVASRSKFLNEVIIYSLGSCFMGNTLLFRRIHLAHHAFTNRGEKDPDHFTASKSLAWRWVKSFALIFSYYYYAWTQLRKHITFRQAAVSGITPVAILGAGIALGRLDLALCGWVLPSFVAQGLLGFTFTSWPHDPGEDPSRFGNTKIHLVWMPLEWIMGQQNFHLIHHLKPDLPWFRYRAYWLEHRDELLAQGAKVTDYRWPKGARQE